MITNSEEQGAKDFVGSILPPPQRALWPELEATPDHFTLYGGAAGSVS